MAANIFIIGLNEIGASVSMALSETEIDLSITGYDANSKRGRESRKRGEINRLVLSPKKGVRSADLIFLSVSPVDLHYYLEVLAETMKKDAVLIDMSPLKVSAMGWAEELMPEGRFYVGAVPVLNPELLRVDKDPAMPARPDLFQGGIFALTMPPNTPERVINITMTISRILGAEPFFMDPHEVDAAVATVEGLPAVFGAALMKVAMNAASWRDLQRMASRSWATATRIAASQPPGELAASLTMNKTNMMHKLDALVDELTELRKLIWEAEEGELADHLGETSNAFGSWLATRESGDWDGKAHKPLSIPKTGLLGRLLGGGDFQREEEA